MNEQDILLAQAVNEYEQDGVVSTTTFVAMSEAGMDAEEIINDIEETT